MHTDTFRNEEGNHIYIHRNGGYDGDVHIQKYDDVDEVKLQEVTIPFEVLEQLVGQKVNSDLISKLEDMDGKETLRFLYE